MRIIVICFSLLAFQFSLAQSPEPATQNSPEAPAVNERAQNSPRALMQRERVKRMKERAKKDGVVTRAERKEIRQAKGKAARAIHRKKNK